MKSKITITQRIKACFILLVSGSLLSENELESIIDQELVKLDYDVSGSKTSDFVDGFVRGYEYAHGVRLNEY